MVKNEGGGPRVFKSVRAALGPINVCRAVAHCLAKTEFDALVTFLIDADVISAMLS